MSLCLNRRCCVCGVCVRVRLCGRGEGGLAGHAGGVLSIPLKSKYRSGLHHAHTNTQTHTDEHTSIHTYTHRNIQTHSVTQLGHDMNLLAPCKTDFFKTASQ